MESLSLRQAIQKVQEIGLRQGFTIVIVGGALVRLIGSTTKIKKIDEKRKTIFLEHGENPGTTRGEDLQVNKKTIVDIDGIAFSNVADPFSSKVKADYLALQGSLQKMKKNISDFPAISIEPVLYHPYFPKPHELFQFVSSIESYHCHGFFFRLGGVMQDVRDTSLAFWTYVFEETQEQVISLSPLAIQERYTIRGFSIKPKDKEKIWGATSPFAKFVMEFNKQTKNDYKKDYEDWHIFNKQIKTTLQPSMRLKKALWNTYWKTIGTYLAHGTGFVGRLLLPLGNTFFAGK